MVERGAFRISLFGQPRFALGEAPYVFAGPPKALPLLSYLLLNRRGPLARDAVAFTLWADNSEEDARANLRRHLFLLGRALPEADQPWILADGASVQWNSASEFWLDVAEFERFAADVDTAEAAVALYTGDLLETLYDDWVIAHRDRLRGTFLSILDRIVQDRRHARDFRAAAEYAEKMLACDPWREDAVRHLMIARYEIGDRSGALQTFESLRRRLREEMDVDPMPETVAVREAIIRDEPLPGDMRQPEKAGRTAPRHEVPVASHVSVGLPFVGRARELDYLRASWDAAVAGSGKLIFISGEAGIGKSRLAADFALAVEREGGRVLYGTTSSPESAPYQCLADALRFALPLVAALRIDPIWLAGAAQLVRDLRSRRSDLPALPATTADRDRIRLFESLAVVFTALAASRPAFLILEDLHWAGETTMSAIDFLAARFAAARVLAVATYREEEAPRSHPVRALRRRLEAAGFAQHLSPAPLDGSAIRELLTSVPALAGQSAALAPSLLGASDGNPFFATEIVRDWLDRGVRESPIDEPPPLRDTIAARLARLAPATRSCAEIAAVVGRGFDVDILCEIAGWPEDQVLRALDELLDRAVVRESSGRARYAYAFRHQLIQATLYDSIPDEMRMRRHRRAARVIEELHAANVTEFAAELARHYDLGAEAASAAKWCLAAGRRAADVYANAEAEAQVTRGLELAADERLQLDLVRLREALRGRRGDRAGQQADVEEFARLAHRLNDPEALFEATFRQVLLARSLGDRDREAQHITRLHDLAAEDVLKRARASLVAAEHAALVGRVDEAESRAAEALNLYESCRVPRGAAEAAHQQAALSGAIETLCVLAEIAAHQASLADSQTRLDRARSLAAESPNRALRARVTMTAAATALVQQRFSECLELCGAAREIYRSIGDREGEADALARSATAAGRLYKLDDARRANAEAADIFASIGKLQGLATRRMNDCILSFRFGLLDDARKAALSALELFERLDDVRGQCAAMANVSAAAIWQGDAQAAKSYATRALELANRLQHRAYMAGALANLGAAERDLGELQPALEHMSRGLALREGISRTPDTLVDLADFTLANLRAGKIETAQRTADEMLEIADRSTEGALWPQYVYCVAAHVYRALKRRSRAHALMVKARTLLDEYLKAIADPSLRTRFLELPFNAEIVRYAQRDSVAPAKRRAVQAVHKRLR